MSGHQLGTGGKDDARFRKDMMGTFILELEAPPPRQQRVNKKIEGPQGKDIDKLLKETKEIEKEKGNQTR